VDKALIGYIDYNVTLRAFTSLSSGTWTMDADLVVENVVDFMSCDEYPFRSTYEGAWFEKGRQPFFEIP
jgi:hypothetical protein